MQQFVTKGDYTESEVWSAIRSLANNGHIFETSKKNTFRHSGSTDLRQEVLHFMQERGAALQCVVLFVISAFASYR